jgi:hypothetical protein
MEGLAFEPDDAPFVPSLVAARAASPMMITGGRWTKTAFSTIREHRLDLELIDWSGFPADVPLRDGFHHRATRLSEIAMRGAAHPVDAVIFVASAAAEDAAANDASLAELRSLGLFDRTVFQVNKRDVESAFSVDTVVDLLGVAGRPVVESNARTGRGIFDALKAAVRIAMERAVAPMA